MNKQELLKAIGTYEGDLEDVLELLEILNGERCNNDNHNDALTWSAIKGTAKNLVIQNMLILKCIHMITH